MDIVLFKKHIKLRTLLMIAFAIFIVIFAISSGIGLRTEYMQYKEIGENFVNVFWTDLITKLIVMAVSFVFIFFAIYLTNIFIRKGLKKICDKEHVMFVKTPNKSLAVVVAAFGSYAFANSITSTLLSFINAAWFNVADPIFGKNISYFIFQRPLLMMLVESLSSLLILIIIYTLAYYIIAISVLAIRGISKETFLESSFISHNFVNVILFLIVTAVGFYLNVEGLVFSTFLDRTVDGTTTALVGAGFIEANISRYVYMALPYITIACSIVAAIFLRRGKFKKTLITLAIIPAVLVVHAAIVFVTDTFIVSPNELEMEKEYIGYNMEYTKQAYNLDVDEKSYDVSTDFTLNDIKENSQLVDNARILDYNATLKVLNQYQTIKGYYKFNDVDIAVYDIDGKPTAVFISARELNEKQLKDKSYALKRFQYTHGYGVVVTSVNSIDDQGYPDYIIKDITEDLSNKGLNILEPRIYYGELINEPVIVNANNIKEFDYPAGETEVKEYEYAGDAGIKMTLGNRILMAFKYADPKLVYSQYIDDESSLLINRNITERAQKVAPFLQYDNDPYLVITDEGRLVWVLDAYTTTSNYPYSQVTKVTKKYANGTTGKYEFNYIRNSVKVLVDAYDGTTKFYVVDRNDPIVMSYYKMYPGLFEDLEAGIPEQIWDHIRYPEYLYQIQVDQLLSYHVKNVEIFYRNEDVWETATHNNGTKEEVMKPYYGLTVLDGNLEFALMQQFTPNNRSNLIAWAAMKSSKDEYGKMELYKFNTDTNILGTIQFDNQIDQNAEISKDLSLWSSGGSSIIRSMTIVPIENSLLYIEPIYLAAMNESQIPAIKKIIVSNGKDLAMADTFKEALEKLLSEESIEITVENTDTIEDIVEAIIQTNANLKQSAQNANWEMYGIYMQKMDDLIEQLEKISNEQEISQE